MLKMYKHKETGVLFASYELNGEEILFNSAKHWKATADRLAKLEGVETDPVELLRIITNYCDKRPYGILTKEIKPLIPMITKYI